MSEDGFIDFDIQGKIDTEIWRLICKISFNYFAYCAIESGFDDLLYEDYFEKIRSFVLTGTGNVNLEVKNHGLNVVGYENRNNIPFHFIRISAKGNRIYSNLSLFGHFRYIVELSGYPFRTINQSAFGAQTMFDLVNKSFKNPSDGGRELRLI